MIVEVVLDVAGNRRTNDELGRRFPQLFSSIPPSASKKIVASSGVVFCLNRLLVWSTSVLPSVGLSLASSSSISSGGSRRARAGLALDARIDPDGPHHSGAPALFE